MEFHERPLVYIAGPYTNGDPVENTHHTIEVANHLHDSGLATCIVPHISLFWHVITPKPYTHWLAYDIALLKVCHALLRLRGDSDGADDEVKWAIDHNIPVFYSIATLLEWAKGWGGK